MASTDRRLHWMNVIFPDSIDFPGNTDGIIAPSGLTSERPTSPVNGYIRYNTTENVLEAYTGGIWSIIGSSGNVGITNFLGLTDTPSIYPTGTPVLRVNIGQTGVEFTDGNSIWLPLSGGTMNSGQHITMNGGTIRGVPSPQFNNDVANKEYVDGIAAGLAVKESVHSATTGNIDLSSQGLNGIDGHGTYDDGDRVLVKDQTLPAENGIYEAHTGPWTRSLDMDGTPANEVQGGTTTYVQDGTANGNTNWVVIADGNVAVGTDPMNWSLISSGGTQNLWETIDGDGGSVAATSPIDTLTIAGGTGVSTAMAGSTLTITNDSPNADQNVFGTITGDSGTTVGTAAGRIVAIVGDGSTISTTITNNDPSPGLDKITLSVLSAAPSSRLQDADNNTFVDTDFGGSDSNNLRLETGVNLTNGGAIDILTSSGTDGGLSTDGGDGGSVQITTGSGGDGIDGGNGGSITITAGDYGPTASDGANGVGGSITLLPGGTGSVSGKVVLGLASHKWPNADGANGEVLTTDGSGNLSFAAGGGGIPSRIEDADQNTYIDVEETTDVNAIRFGIESSSGNHVGGKIANWDENNIEIGSKGGYSGLNGAVGFQGTKIEITTGFGGNANPGVAVGGAGGALYMHGGNGGNGDSGTNTSGGDGGDVSIRGGYGSGGTGDYSGQADGGKITIKAGKGADSGDGGRLDILAGHGGAGDYATNGGAGGIITIVAGNGKGATNGGGIFIQSGSGGNLSTAKGGAITIETEQSNASGVVGPDVTIETGKGGSGAVAGNIVLSPGGYSGSSHGAVIITATVGYANVSTELRFAEARNQGTNVVALKAPNALSADAVFTLPGVDGANGKPLTTDGSGTLGFNGPGLFTGTGSPESVVTAPVGSIYTDSTGGAGTTLYIKESGAGNTGWIAK